MTKLIWAFVLMLLVSGCSTLGESFYKSHTTKEAVLQDYNECTPKIWTGSQKKLTQLRGECMEAKGYALH